jgi:hypothetical protein
MRQSREFSYIIERVVGAFGNGGEGVAINISAGRIPCQRVQIIVTEHGVWTYVEMTVASGRHCHNCQQPPNWVKGLDK